MDEMQRMVRVDRWSWRDLARSLNEAGITYAGGQWTAALLGDKIAGLRWRQRKRDERAATPSQGLPVEALREVLGNLGSIQHLTINIQGTPSGPMTATLAGQPATVPTVSAPATPMPQAAPTPAPTADPTKVPAQTAPSPGGDAEPPPPTFGYVKLRGVDRSAKAPLPPSPPLASAEPPTPDAPAVNVDDVLARFAPGTTQRRSPPQRKE